jgi:hemoglobin
VVCALALATGGLRAGDAPPDRKALDKQIYETLRVVINRGADIYNAPSSDWNGCYRFYEGALLATQPLLKHRPELQKAIETGLATARANPQVQNRAFDLRAVIDRIRDETNPNPKATTASLWDRLGGEANVKKVVDDFVAAAATDPKVDFFRKGKFKDTDVPTLKRLLVEFVSAAAGGPLKYSGRTMKESHKGMGITDAEFDALAGHLKAALEKNGAKPADVTAVLTAVGGTRKDIVEAKDSETTKEKTLWERLGGEANVKKVVHEFVVAAASDKKVDFDRKLTTGKAVSFDVADLEKLLVDFVSSATGGPRKYTGRTMKESHKGMRITDDQFNALAGHLKKALEDNGAKPDDVKAVLDAVGGTRKDIVEPKESTSKEKTLWERLGGEDNVKKVVDDFVAAAAKDNAKVDFFRGGKSPLDEQGVATLKKRLVEFVSAATGGPLPYKGKTMKELHKGMGITDAQFDALAGHLKTALEKNGAKPADVTAVLEAVGGTRKDIVEK